jgi:hypothetical protein
MNKRIATTVKVEETIYDDFKVLGVRHKLTLQGLMEKSVYLYVNDDSFREIINSFILPITSGAEFPQTCSWITPGTTLTASFFQISTTKE